MHDTRPLAAASRALRQRERVQKADAKRATEAKPAPTSGVEVVAAMKQSREVRTKLLEEIQGRLARIVASGTRGDLDRLAGALSLFERRIERREAKP